MNQVNQLIKQAKKYLIKYDYEKVSHYCDKILDIEPNSGWALNFKGISYYKTDCYEKAIPYYKKLLKRYPDDSQIKYTLAFLNERIGNYYQALTYYNNYDYDYQRNRLLTKMGKYDFLIKEYDDKISQLRTNEHKYDTQILVLLEEKAVFHYRNNEYEEAYTIFKEISSNYSQTLKNIRHPWKRCGFWYNKLQQYIEEYKEPIEFFNHMFILTKDDNGWTNKLNHNICFGDPFVFGDLLLELNPNNTVLLERYGNFSIHRNYQYSLKCFYKILEIEPDNQEIIGKIIDIYSRTYSKNKALKLIDSKLKYSNIRVYLLKEKIKLLESMTLYSEALETYELYFKYASRMDKELASMKVDYIICMESYALDLYNQDNLEQSYNLLKKAYLNLDKIKNYDKQKALIRWYDEVVKDAIDKSDGNPAEFFNNFHTPNDNQTKIWIEKLEATEVIFELQKEIGNKTYIEIMLDKNENNYELAIYEARKYYTGLIKPKKALPVFERVLKIDPYNKEILNQKFNMLVHDKQYAEAYHLLTKISIDYFIIHYCLKELADIYIDSKEYMKAKNCLEIILNIEFDHLIIKKLKYVLDKSNDTKCQREYPFYMQWITLIKNKYDENTCPQCKNKLIPIKYGVFLADDVDLKSNKYYMSKNIKQQKNRPTDYCIYCKQEIYHGFCGLNIIEDNIQLSRYTKEVILWLITYLENNHDVKIEQLQHDIYEKFSINKEENQALINKLENINFIEFNGSVINICCEYNNFKNSINEMYNYTTKIFNNETELKEYAKTITKSKKYVNVEEYIEDIKICLMISTWKYSYKSATELLKRAEYDIRRNFIFETDPWADAMEYGYSCG